MRQLPALLLRVWPHTVMEALDQLKGVAGGCKVRLVRKVPAWILECLPSALAG